MAHFRKDHERFDASKIVNIIGWETVEENYTAYIIQVTLGSYRWTVKHRYREFLELHDKLVSKYDIKKNLLPGKKLFGNQSDTFIKKRQGELEVYLQAIIHNLPTVPPILGHFLDFNKYEIHGITGSLAEELFSKGEWLLHTESVYRLSTLHLTAITERLKLPEPTCDSGNPKQDLGHILDFITRLRHLKVAGSIEPVGNSNIIMNYLSFDVSLFKGLHALELTNLNTTKLCGLENLKRSLKKLYVHRCIGSPKEILLQDFLELSSMDDENLTVPAWSSLTWLDLSQNEITSLDESIKLLPRVEYLDLHDNRLEDISHLCHLSTLTHLDLSNNCIHRLEDLHTKLGNIKSINLAGNKLESLQGVAKLYSLEYLDVSNNEISQILEIRHVASLPCIENVNLIGNPVTVVLDYRTKVLQMFSERVKEVCIDNQKATDRELDTVAVLMAIQKAKDDKEKCKKGHQSKKVSAQVDIEDRTQQSTADPRELPVIDDSTADPSLMRNTIESMRERGGVGWLQSLNALQDAPTVKVHKFDSPYVSPRLSPTLTPTVQLTPSKVSKCGTITQPVLPVLVSKHLPAALPNMENTSFVSYLLNILQEQSRKVYHEDHTELNQPCHSEVIQECQTKVNLQGHSEVNQGHLGFIKPGHLPLILVWCHCIYEPNPTSAFPCCVVLAENMMYVLEVVADEFQGKRSDQFTGYAQDWDTSRLQQNMEQVEASMLDTTQENADMAASCMQNRASQSNLMCEVNNTTGDYVSNPVTSVSESIIPNLKFHHSVDIDHICHVTSGFYDSYLKITAHTSNIVLLALNRNISNLLSLHQKLVQNTENLASTIQYDDIKNAIQTKLGSADVDVNFYMMCAGNLTVSETVELNEEKMENCAKTTEICAIILTEDCLVVGRYNLFAREDTGAQTDLISVVDYSVYSKINIVNVLESSEESSIFRIQFHNDNEEQVLYKTLEVYVTDQESKDIVAAEFLRQNVVVSYCVQLSGIQEHLFGQQVETQAENELKTSDSYISCDDISTDHENMPKLAGSCTTDWVLNKSVDTTDGQQVSSDMPNNALVSDLVSGISLLEVNTSKSYSECFPGRADSDPADWAVIDKFTASPASNIEHVVVTDVSSNHLYNPVPYKPSQEELNTSMSHQPIPADALYGVEIPPEPVAVERVIKKKRSLHHSRKSNSLRSPDSMSTTSSGTASSVGSLPDKLLHAKLREEEKLRKYEESPLVNEAAVPRSDVEMRARKDSLYSIISLGSREGNNSADGPVKIYSESDYHDGPGVINSEFHYPGYSTESDTIKTSEQLQSGDYRDFCRQAPQCYSYLSSRADQPTITGMRAESQCSQDLYDSDNMDSLYQLLRSTSGQGHIDGTKPKTSNIDFNVTEASPESRNMVQYMRMQATSMNQDPPVLLSLNYPCVQLLQHLSLCNEKLDLINPLSGPMQELAAMNGDEIVNFFHKNIIQIGMENEELRHLVWCPVIPYIVPTEEIITCVMLSSRAAYFVSDHIFDSRKRGCKSQYKMHSRNKSDSLIGQNFSMAESHHSSGILHRCSLHGVVRPYHILKLTDLRHVTIGMFDQCFRLSGDTPDTVLSCITRNHLLTETFVQELMRVLMLYAASPSPDLQSSGDDFYHSFRSSRSTSTVSNKSSNYDHPSKVKFHYASEELVVDLSYVIVDHIPGRKPNVEDVSILGYLLVFEMENQTEAKPRTLVLTSTHLTLLDEDLVHYPLPDFVMEPPAVLHYRILDIRNIEYLQRVVLSDFKSHDLSLVFSDLTDDIIVDTSVEYYSTDEMSSVRVGEITWKLAVQNLRDKDRLLKLLSKTWADCHADEKLSIQVSE